MSKPNWSTDKDEECAETQVGSNLLIFINLMISAKKLLLSHGEVFIIREQKQKSSTDIFALFRIIDLQNASYAKNN